jgi:hypothetical protein
MTDHGGKDNSSIAMIRKQVDTVRAELKESRAKGDALRKEIGERHGQVRHPEGESGSPERPKLDHAADHRPRFQEAQAV